MGCTAVFLIECRPTFQRYMLPPSSPWKFWASEKMLLSQVEKNVSPNVSPSKCLVWTYGRAWNKFFPVVLQPILEHCPPLYWDFLITHN
jgi:hypothetical protein